MLSLPSGIIPISIIYYMKNLHRLQRYSKFVPYSGTDCFLYKNSHEIQYIGYSPVINTVSFIRFRALWLSEPYTTENDDTTNNKYGVCASKMYAVPTCTGIVLEKVFVGFEKQYEKACNQ